jgi:hypothetical protein
MYACMLFRRGGWCVATVLGTFRAPGSRGHHVGEYGSQCSNRRRVNMMATDVTAPNSDTAKALGRFDASIVLLVVVIQVVLYVCKYVCM